MTKMTCLCTAGKHKSEIDRARSTCDGFVDIFVVTGKLLDTKSELMGASKKYVHIRGDMRSWKS